MGCHSGEAKRRGRAQGIETPEGKAHDSPRRSPIGNSSGRSIKRAAAPLLSTNASSPLSAPSAPRFIALYAICLCNLCHFCRPTGAQSAEIALERAVVPRWAAATPAGEPKKSMGEPAPGESNPSAPSARQRPTPLASAGESVHARPPTTIVIRSVRAFIDSILLSMCTQQASFLQPTVKKKNPQA